MDVIGVCIAVWIVSAIGAAGLFFAYFQGKYGGDPDEDLAMGLLFGLIGGPVTLFVAFFMSAFGKHGWRLK